MTDFNIQKEVSQVTKISGNRVDASFSPTAGSHVAVAYIEAGVNRVAILAKLAEIEALSDNYGQKIWPVTAQPEKTASVQVRVIVNDNVGE